MERSPGAIDRPSYKLLRKLAPSYWASVRRVRSQESVRPPDHLLGNDDSQDTSSPIYGTALQVDVKIEGNCSRHPTDRMPFPIESTASQNPPASIQSQRKSSANREAFIHPRRTDSLQRLNGTSKRPEGDRRSIGEIPQGFVSFDDDLLQPEQASQVAKMASLFPAPARSSVISNGSIREQKVHTISRRPSDQSLPSPRGRPLNKSPKMAATKTPSSHAQARKYDLIAPLSQRIPSPSTFDVPHNLTAPAILSARELAQLHVSSPDKNELVNTEPNVEDDPDSWDVIRSTTSFSTSTDSQQTYSLERRAEELYSAEHLEIIMEDKEFRRRFSQFLRSYRPWREPILNHYLNANKAMKALAYANALTGKLAEWKPPYDSLVHPPATVKNMELDLAAKEAFDELLRDDLHFYIAHVWTEMVSVLVQRRITGTLAPHLREASTGLAEVFVITDPNREDSPIILASEMFSVHSGCSLEYIIGRNCRFLQGPCTTVDSVRHFAISNQEAKDHTEIIVNYRRDGTPFLSLVMNAPLLDSYGKVRYFLGAQVDVSGLLKDCSGLESLSRLIEQRAKTRQDSADDAANKPDQYGTLKALSETFSAAELALIRKQDLSPLQPEYKIHDTDKSSKISSERRLFLADGSGSDSDDPSEPSLLEPHQAIDWPISSGNLSGIYKYYLLVRPAPSLRILFASPTLSEPGLLQTPFLNRIGGSTRMRSDLDSALRASKPVTARVRWLKAANDQGDGDGSTRWLHCTPLMHCSNQVGMWMVVVVQPEKETAGSIHSDKSSRSGLRDEILERSGPGSRR